jgi:hypothetical protein
MYELITVLLTTFVLLNITHKRKNIDSTIANIATFKVFKHILLHVSWAILFKYSSRTVKARAVYESTDGPAGQPADNPPNWNRLAAVHWTIPKLTVRVYWRPRPHLCWRVNSIADPDPKRRSWTLANTSCNPYGTYTSDTANFKYWYQYMWYSCCISQAHVLNRLKYII